MSDIVLKAQEEMLFLDVSDEVLEVVAGAAKLVWARTIRNVSAAQVCAQLESDYLGELRVGTAAISLPSQAAHR